MKRSYRLTPRGSRRNAELFLADLMGEPVRRRARRFAPYPVARARQAPAPVVPRYPAAVAPPPPMPARDEERDDDLSEGVPLGGRGAFRHEPLGGIRGDNVETRFNVDSATPAGSSIDVVVYFHGYSSQPDDAQFLPRKAAAAGLDMVDGGTVRVRASQPTLALVPRGRHTSGATWLFDRLPDRAALDRLIDAGLSWLCTTALALPSPARLRRGRLTLAAHSGGGAALSALLAGGVNPDEVICFDSMYGGEEAIRRWALARIASNDAPRSGLRVFYTGCSGPSPSHPGGRWVAARGGKLVYQPPGSWSYRNGKWRLITTEVSARRLHEAIGGALAQASGGQALTNRFRVQRTSVAHSDIPARYSPALLDNIAADVPDASAPPAATSRPACVANDDWLTRPPRKPGGDDAPPPPPSAVPTSAPTSGEPRPAPPSEIAYTPPNARPYTPSADRSLFRTPPDPVAVTAATEWPQATTDADAASERALRARGVSADQIRGFGATGLTALRPIASVFGEPALGQLFLRLRYRPAQFVRPPHSYAKEADLNRAFGRPVPRMAILAIRSLLAIPGHFRELARRAGSEDEAFALENIGWLLMHSLAGDVRTGSGLDFWLPASPSFVTPFPASVSALSPQTTELITARSLLDRSVEPGAYRTRFTAWQSGAPGRMWRLETARDTSQGRGAGAPFYADPFTIPPSISITTERAQVRAAWARRVADVDAGRTTVPLTQCDNAYVTRIGVMGPISLRGLQLRTHFPAPSSARALTSLNGLAAVQTAFEAAFQAITDLGWNDLVFETQGMGCFRGKKIPGNPAAARNMSEHSLGIAIDLNVFENQQNTPGSMDPRIVALFEAFRFRWGKDFTTPDPMHFEYAG